MTQEFIEAFDKWSEYLNQLGYRKVVLCKECKHERTKICPLASAWDAMPSNFYCAIGERKTE